MPSPLGDLLTQRHLVILAAARVALAGYVVRAWDALGSYDDVDGARFLELVVPAVTTATAHASMAVDAYMAAFVSVETGEPVSPLGVVAPARTVGPETIYRRPFTSLRMALADGKPFADAVNAGRTRARVLAETDVQAAARNTAAEVTASTPQIVGYRRVLGGGGRKHCSLCLVAASRIYHDDELMPIHAACGCGQEPLVGDSARRPGGTAENGPQARYGRLSLVADRLPAGVDASSLPDVDVVEHGELGPVLVDAAHRFSRLGDLPA